MPATSRGRCTYRRATWNSGLKIGFPKKRRRPSSTAPAGVGTLGIVDSDVVDLTNLQRQILHTTDRIGESKVSSAKRTLEALNPDVKIVGYEERLGAANIDRIIEGYDLVIDGADNFPTRYLLNDASA